MHPWRRASIPRCIHYRNSGFGVPGHPLNIPPSPQIIAIPWDLRAISLPIPFSTAQGSLLRRDHFQNISSLVQMGRHWQDPWQRGWEGKNIKAQNCLSPPVLLQVIGIANEFHAHVRQVFFSFFSSPPASKLSAREAMNDHDGPALVSSLKPWRVFVLFLEHGGQAGRGHLKILGTRHLPSSLYPMGK